MTITRRYTMLATMPLWFPAMLVGCVLGAVLLGAFGTVLLAISFFQEP